MPRIAINRSVDAPAATVWRLLADFADVSWIPVAGRVDVHGVGVGMSRSIHGGRDVPVVETLTHLDERGMQLGYSISENPLPVRRFEALVEVRPEVDASKATVTWNVDYDPIGSTENDAVAARESIEAVYEMMAGWLADAAAAGGRT